MTGERWDRSSTGSREASSRPSGTEPLNPSGYIELGKTGFQANVARSPAERLLEERAGEGEGVIFAVLATDVDSRLLDVRGEAPVGDASEPGLIQLRQLDACEHGPPARSNELAQQCGRGLAPDGLDMLQPGSGHAALIPFPHAAELYAAEPHPAEP